TTPIPPPCARRWRCSPTRSRVQGAAASPFSATCLSSARVRERCTPISPTTSGAPASICCSPQGRRRRAPSTPSPTPCREPIAETPPSSRSPFSRLCARETSSCSRDRTRCTWVRWRNACGLRPPQQRRCTKDSDHVVVACGIFSLLHALQCLSLHHLPRRLRGGDRALLRILLRPAGHQRPARQAGQRAADPRGRSRLASPDQERHAHDGRPDDSLRARRGHACLGQSEESLHLDRALRHGGLRLDRLLRRLSQSDEAVAFWFLRLVAARLRIRDWHRRLLSDD